MSDYSVLGSGAWGTALANIIALSYGKVTLYSRDINLCKELNFLHKNSKYLPDIALSDKILATSDLTEVSNSDVWFIAIPCQNLRSFLKVLKQFNYKNKKLIICSKGIEYNTLKFPAQIVQEELPGVITGLLSGPNFAIEIAQLLPSSTLLAFNDVEHSKKIIDDISSKFFCIEVSSDINGLEVLGATKNIMAIMCGILKGKKLGENMLASFITKALSEVTNLTLKRQGKIETVNSVAGIGDLILSCTNSTSRNFKFGQELGEGISLNELMAKEVTVEGYYSTKAIYELAMQLDVKMPITDSVYNILYRNYKIDKVIDSLLTQKMQ